MKSIPFSELDDEDKTNLGITYFKLGRYNDAIEILKNINNENIPDSKYILTASYFNIGKYDEAKLLIDKNWEQILKAKKTDQINFRGMIYFYEKNYEKAIETLEKTLEINPDDVQAANGLSRIYAAKGETEKAEEYLAKVQEGFDKLVIEERQKTNLVEKLHKLQEAYQAKRFQEVIDLANEVLPNAQAKNKAALYQYLYNSYLALGMTKEAQETMAKAKQMQQQ